MFMTSLFTQFILEISTYLMQLRPYFKFRKV